MVHRLTTQFAWSFDEYNHAEKTTKWFIAFGLVIIAGAILAALLGNTLLTGVILIGGGFLAILARNKPRERSIEISERGIKFDEELYPYEKLSLFWINENIEDPELLILSDQTLFPLLVAPIPAGVDLINLRDYLGNFIEEQELREPWIYKLVDHLGI